MDKCVAEVVGETQLENRKRERREGVRKWKGVNLETNTVGICRVQID